MGAHPQEQVSFLLIIKPTLIIRIALDLNSSLKKYLCWSHIAGKYIFRPEGKWASTYKGKKKMIGKAGDVRL